FRSQAGGVTDEAPAHAKFFTEMLRERFHAEGFRRVMAAVENIDSKILRHGVSPMRTFTRDESIHSFRCGDFHFGSRATCNHADAPANFISARQQFRGSAGGFLESPLQFSARNFQRAAHSQIAPLFEEKWF